jgi:hypothetical protein
VAAGWAVSRADEIRARLEAATPGPWKAAPEEAGRSWCDIWSPTTKTTVVVADSIDRHRGGKTERISGVRISSADADLIAHAPADLAWALGEFERLEDALCSQRDALRLDTDKAALVDEVARLTEERDDARESLRVEREDRARTLAALRECAEHITDPWHPAGGAYRHAADLVERGGR